MSVNNFEDHDVQMLELSALHQWKQGADEESTTITTFSHEYHFWGEGLKKFSRPLLIFFYLPVVRLSKV